MNEELYVFVGNKKYSLDLNVPSGIILKYVSNLFNDITKITSSHSYTFKLPKTANNIRVLDLADDIRHNSSMTRKKLAATFIQNGIPLFRAGNLYIDSVGDCFQAVFTWGVVKGLEELKDNDISLNELPEIGTAYYLRHGIGPVKTYSELDNNLFSNNLDVIYPFYYAGIVPEQPYGFRHPWLTIEMNDEYLNLFQKNGHNMYCGLPVVPIYKIVALINQHYGVNFKLGEVFSHTDWNDLEGTYESNGCPDILNRGVVPLVKWGQSNELLESVSPRVRFSTNARTYFNVNLVVLWRQFNQASSGNYFTSVANDYPASDGATLYVGVKPTSALVGKDLELDGIVVVTYDAPIYEPQLKVYTLDDNYQALEVASLDGVDCTSGTNYQYRFDFRADYGNSRLNVTGENVKFDKTIFIGIPNGTPTKMSAAEIRFIPSFKPESIYSPIPISITQNLPDVSCLTFIKSLYYMIGAFPSTDNDGNIIALYYKQIKENIEHGKIYNWSRKSVNPEAYPVNVKFDIGGFAQNNYFLMKNDILGEYKKERDFYERGKGCIKVDNTILEYSKTIFQIPFYGKYLEDLQYYYINTGETVKMWEKDGNDVSAVESKPAIGLIYGRKWYDYKHEMKYDDEGKLIYNRSESGDYVLSMEIWDGFKNILKNESYNYLQSILKQPIVIKETLLLNEFDLRDLDYTVPIYLEKYNSYFAIITLERNSKGICNAELIKLPNI